MDTFKSWWERFKTWVRYEPVRAAETVRTLLFALTGILAFFGPGLEGLATQIAGAITALFSIYASQSARNKVTPMAKVEDEIEAESTEEMFSDV